MTGERDEDADGTAEVGSDGDALGAAWGGGGGETESGPPPRREDVETDGDGHLERGPGAYEPSAIDKITVVLQEHKTVFTVALLAYGLLVMPWLYQNGFEVLGFVLGAAFLGGAILVTVANAHEAREKLQGDERRGF